MRELVLCELSLAVAVAGVMGGPAWWAPASAVAVAGLALAVLRRRGLGAGEWLAAAVSFRVRVRDRRPGSGDGLLGVRGLRSYAYEDRARRVVGMVGDGTFLTAVVRVEAGGAGLRPVGEGRELPLSLLADALEVDGITLASAQLVQQVRRGRQARGPGAPTLAPTAPALRLTWVALRLEPELCAQAVAARGGGLGGAQRCLVRAADQVASRITGAGLRAVVLDQDGLDSAAQAAGCSSDEIGETDRPSGRGGPDTSGTGETGLPHGRGGPDTSGTGETGRPPRRGGPDTSGIGETGRPPRRGGPGTSAGAESARVWRGGGLLHTTYAVTGPAGAAECARRLSTAPADGTTTVGLTVRRGATSWRALDVSGHIRVSRTDEDELVIARRELEAAARTARVGVVRLDREQWPGLLATLPLGGTR